MNISPKAVWATLVPILASLALFAITGNDTYLVGVLLGLASGGAAASAPPAPGVSQKDVAGLAERRKRSW